MYKSNDDLEVGMLLELIKVNLNGSHISQYIQSAYKSVLSIDFSKTITVLNMRVRIGISSTAESHLPFSLLSLQIESNFFSQIKTEYNGVLVM